MATSYNPKSGSSGSRDTKGRSQRRAPAASGRARPAAPKSASNRSKVSYRQSAKDDLAALPANPDARMRYARYRSDRPLRVLDGSTASSSRSRRASASGRFSAVSDGAAERAADASFASGSRKARSGQGAAGEALGVTVREHRRRRKAALRRGRRASTVLLIIACVLIVLVAAAFFVYQSPLFTVKEVRVEGAQRLGGARLTELAAVAEGSTLLRLDSEGIRERLESDPWVLAAEVHRSFPATVVLVVQERQMAAVVKAPASQDGASPSEAILSEDGVWLAVFATPATTTTTGEGAAGEGEGAEGEGEGEGAAGEGTEGEGEGAGEGSTDADTAGEGAANSETATLPAQGAASLLEDVRLGAAEVEALPLVEDVAQGLSFEVGRAVVDEGVLNALAIINGFSPDMLAQLRSISAPDRVKTMLTLTNNVGVAFGAAEDIEAKEQVIRALLAEHEGRLTYINVRVADRASYRGTD